MLDEIHTDKGGEFVSHLTAFRRYGDDMAAKLDALLAKADDAQAPAAQDSINGVEVLNWTLDGVGTETVKATERAAANTQTRAAGGR